MQKIPLSARDAIKILGVSADRFLRLQDLKKLPAEIIDGAVVYDLHELKKVDFSLPKSEILPDSHYGTVRQALDILKVCRKTFYSKVTKGEIQLYKDGRRSFVKLADLYANDDLF